MDKASTRKERIEKIGDDMFVKFADGTVLDGKVWMPSTGLAYFFLLTRISGKDIVMTIPWSAIKYLSDK